MPVALITGARSLIGQGIAAALSDEGWRLWVTDKDLEGAEAVARKLDATARRMDVTNGDEVRSVVDEILAREGALDGLVNVAGGLRGLGIGKKPFVDSTPDEWQKIIEVNLYGTLSVCRAVLPAMVRQKSGVIASISSSRGLRGGAETSVYSAAKAAIILFTQTMAQDCAEHGIRINAVAPGTALASWKSPTEGTLPPLGGAATGSDIGNAVAFLFSPKARHITGTCIDVSGGAMLH